MEIENILSKFKNDIENSFEEYLKCLSKFYSYSSRNVLLIYSQMPGATNVASFTLWNKLGYRVKKGEKAIKIVCPVKFIDEVTGEEIIKFRYGSVFDISQVVAKAPPKPVQDDDFDIVMAFESLMLAKDSNIKIIKSSDSITWRGLYKLRSKEIYIVEDSVEEMFKILLHEKRHEIALSKLKYTYNKDIDEIIAESAAYVASVKFGIPNNISSDYVSVHCKDKTCDEFETYLTQIVKVSKHLIEWVLNNSYLKIKN